MKHSFSKLAILLGLGSALALPGLAMADSRNPHSLKQSMQQQAREHHRHAAPQHVRHDRHDRKHHNKHHNRHQHRHQGHAPGYHHPGRWGHVSQHGHYHQGHYCTINHVHEYRLINGYYMTPHLGLHFSLH